MSDIGILSSPGDMAIIFLLFGWPALVVGAAIGGMTGWWLRRNGRRWAAAVVGALFGLVAGGVAFAAVAFWWTK